MTLIRGNDVGDGSLAEPNVFVVARHFFLVGHYHGNTISLESHADAGLVSLCDQCLVAEKIHFGLTVQKYDIPEVQLVVEVWCLVEELCDVWLELSVQLCELESLVCNLKVRIFLLFVIIGKVGV